MYGAFDIIKEKTGDDPVKVFKKAVDNVKPTLEVKSRRVGGSNYQVPIEVNPNRRLSLSIRWLVSYAAVARRRQDDAREARERVHGRGESPWRGRQEEGRHAPHGGSQQGVRALSAGRRRTTDSSCLGSLHSLGRGTSASWPTLMPGRPRPPSASCSTPASPTSWVRSTKAPPSWTGWSRSRSGASRSRRPRRRASGATTASTSSTRPATSTSPPRSSARCACSTARWRCSTRCPASSRSRRRSGARPTSTACRASASSTRWTGSARTSSETVDADHDEAAGATRWRSSCRSAPSRTSRASSTSSG